MQAYRHSGNSRIIIAQAEPHIAEVIDFYVDPKNRGNGLGSLLMLVTCADADREGVILELEPWPFGTYDVKNEQYNPPTLTFKELCAFYRKFGFRFKPGRTDIMVRRPRKD